MQELRSQKSPEATNDLYSLACGPDHRVIRYNGCIVNGIRFHTKDKEVNLRTQNSGVVVQGCHQSKEIDFFGVLTDVIVLNYLNSNRVYLFQCDWYDIGNRRTSIQTDGHVTSVNISRTWYKDDRFVLAAQAGQVFYVSDTKLRGSWQVVQKIKPRNVYDISEKEEEIVAEHGVEAFQQEEHVVVNGIVEHDHTLEELNGDNIQNEELATLHLSREDLNPSEVDAHVVLTNMGRVQTEDPFINDDEIDEEEDAMIDYCSYEEENVGSSDDDTDID